MQNRAAHKTQYQSDETSAQPEDGDNIKNDINVEIDSNTDRVNIPSANFFSLFEYSSDFIFSLDKQKKIIYANKSFVNFFNQQHETKLKPGMQILKYFREDEAKVWESQFNNVLKGVSFKSIHSVETSKMRVIYLECSYSPIIIKNEIVGLTAIIRDISDFQLIEDNLNKNFKLLQLIIDNMPVLVAYIDKNEKYIFVNQSYAELVDIPKEKVIGKRVKEVFDSVTYNSLTNYILQVLSGEEVVFETIYIDSNHSEHDILVHYIPHFDEFHQNVKAYFVLSQDISDERKSIQALKDSEDKLKKISSTKDKLFAIIGHDIKSPLSSLMNLTDMLYNEFESFTEEELMNAIQAIFSTTNHINSLFENLLYWAISQTGQINFKLEPIDISQIIKDNLGLYDIHLKNKNIKLNFDFSSSFWIMGDRVMLNSVIRNLISNAIKFSHKKGEISIFFEDAEDYVRLIFKDKGIGIKNEDIKGLFDIENRKWENVNEFEKGTGLGLLLCKDFVEKHNGTFYVFSEVGSGSEFVILLPKKIDDYEI